MRRGLVLALAVAGVVSLGAADGPVAKRAVTAEDLIAIAPVIDSADPKCQSIEVRGRMRSQGEVNLRFRAVYRAPDHFAFLFSDGGDGAPLMFVADGQGVLYDPIEPTLRRIPHGAYALIRLERKGERANFSFGLGLHSKEDADPEEIPRILLDFRSILALAAENQRLIDTGGETYRLIIQRHKESVDHYEFDKKLQPSLQKYVAFLKDELEPFLTLDSIRLNVALRDEEFRLPDLSRLAGKIAVRDFPTDGVLSGVKTIGEICRTAYVRVAAHNPKARRIVPFPRLVGIRWDEIRQHDLVCAPALRELFASQVPKNPPDAEVQRTALPAGRR
jgi:hypothetical protein